MLDTNWELLKFKYEVLGIPIETLALENQISLPVLQFNSKDWKQIPLASKEPLDLKDITSLEDILTKLGSETSSQTKAFAILKQKFLGPKYVELETVLLHKAIEMAGELKSSDPRSAQTLRSLATVLGDLLLRNPLLTVGENEENTSTAREWKVTFVDATDKEKIE
jgi:hypothetical protein